MKNTSEHKVQPEIIVHNHKLGKFEKELIKNGFENYVVIPQKEISTIKVTTEPKKIGELQTLITVIQSTFKSKKNGK